MDFEMLSSKSSWKILDAFLEQPWKQFYLRELIKKTGISPNTAVKMMKGMEKADIFTSQKIGNIIAYKMNEGNEITKKLLMLHHEKRLQKLADEFKVYINRLRRRLENENVVSAVLFGSVPKGEAGYLSDIDILIIHEGKISKKQIGSIFEKYSRYVQIIYFTKNEFIERYENGNEFVVGILKNGIIICDKDFYYKYLFQPLPKPTKDYIEDMLKESDRDLEHFWGIYREKGSFELIAPLLYPLINRVSTAFILLNGQMPESRKDKIKKLEKLKEEKLVGWLKKTRRIWDGEMLKISENEMENILNSIKNILKRCYIKLEEYDG